MKTLIMCNILILMISFGCRITDPNGKGPVEPYIYNIGEINTPGNAHALDLSTGKAYVADGFGGLRVIDISHPYIPREIEKYEDEGMFYDVKYDGRYAYVACGEAGLRIVDIESPFGPEKISSLRTRNAFGLDYAGDYVYLADGSEGVKIFDVSNVYSILEIGSTLVRGQTAYSATLKWPYLYVGSEHGFSIINIENPRNPREIFYESLKYVYDMEIVGHYAYVAYYGGLQIYDVSDVRDPKFLGERILPSPARAVTVRGDYAYLAIGRGGLSINKITNPRRPHEVAWSNPAGSEMNDIALSGRYVYIANGEIGVLVLEFWPGH